MSVHGLDEKDIRIIEILGADPERSQSEMAQEVGISQPSVASRLRRLRRSGVLGHRAGLDVHAAGGHIGRVDAAARDPRAVLEMFSVCPFFINGVISSGRRNLTLLFCAWDIPSLEEVVDLHLRSREDVSDVELSIIVSATRRILSPRVPPPGSERMEWCRRCPNYPGRGAREGRGPHGGGR